MSLIQLNKKELRDNAIHHNGTLRHEDYIKWDERLIPIAQTRLTLVGDLMALGLTDTSYTLGDYLSKYEKISEMTAANVNMDGRTRGQMDMLTFTEAGVPLPVFRKDFSISERMLQAGLKSGAGLRPSYVDAATRQVAEQLESAAIDGVPSIVVDSTQIYGITNHPNRNTHSISNSWGGGSEDPVGDIEAMLAKAYADNFFGPFNIYVSKDNWAFIQGDYSSSKGDRTYKERFEAFADINAVRPLDKLADGEVILVQMTQDVIDLAIAVDMTVVEQPQLDVMDHQFSVMSIMAPRVKSDQGGKSGIVHATGA